MAERKTPLGPGHNPLGLAVKRAIRKAQMTGSRRGPKPKARQCKRIILAKRRLSKKPKP